MKAQIGARLLSRINDRSATVGIIGMGYVGLPLALALVNAGFTVTGFDVDEKKASQLNAGRSYFKHIDSAKTASAIATQRFSATTDFAGLSECDVIAICVPTPLDHHNEPNLSFVTDTADKIAHTLRQGQLVVLESTTYPGTTDEVVKDRLELGGMKSGKDFFLAFSPEREDPGNLDFGTTSIPKVVGADDDVAREAAFSFYSAFIDTVVPVSSTRTAEATKLTENIFRSVNIALVNELKVIFEPMGVDVWEVIEAAKTKPFGFMPFYPGPGLGGHCIPIDPFYLTWKAREYAVPTRFIELAGQINSSMPTRVVEKLALAVDQRHERGLRGTKILVLGAAYKKNVDDMRESPALQIMELLEKRQAKFDYYDPFVAEIPKTREHPGLRGRSSVAWKEDLGADYDAVLLVTDHDDFDYEAILRHAPLVVDTRNAFRKAGLSGENLFQA